MAAEDLTTEISIVEEWRRVPALFASRRAYEISNHGRVRRVQGRDRRGGHLPGKILSPCRNTWGGLYIRLDDHRHLVHNIVAEAFLGPQPDGYRVSHADGDKTNNRLSNLAYVCYDVTPLGDTHEEWRPVSSVYDPSGRYEVSNIGRVRRRAWVDRLGRPVRARLLRPHKVPRGYLAIQFGKKRHLIHRVVVQSFLGPYPVDQEINHRDGNKQNNRDTNLEYVTHVDNMIHAATTGLIVRGEHARAAKLTEDDVRAIRAAQGQVNYLVLGERYGVNPNYIYHIWNREKWAWLDPEEAL